MTTANAHGTNGDGHTDTGKQHIRQVEPRDAEAIANIYNHSLHHSGQRGKHHYYVHTQSFKSTVDDMTEYCHRKGGGLT